MKKQWKRMPFTIELAKKIQSGEVEGRITNEHGDNVRIVCFDRSDFLGNPSIIALYKSAESYYEKIGEFGVKGESYEDTPGLCIELPEEAPKHEFKPFDKVLVKPYDMSESMENVNVWRVDVFSHIDKCTGDYVCIGGLANPKYTLPYEGNEHLVGTTDNP